MKMGNTPGAQSRFAMLRVPGSQLGVEVIEYKDIARKPVDPGFQDPGAANLILTVRDLDAVMARVRKAGTRIVTKAGGPVTMDAGKGASFRVVFLKDPDGFSSRSASATHSTDHRLPFEQRDRRELRAHRE